MNQRSFNAQPPQALQQPARTAEAPAILDMPCILARSERTLPIPRRRHACDPICNANVLTNTGTSNAAGVIGSIAIAPAPSKSMGKACRAQGCWASPLGNYFQRTVNNVGTSRRGYAGAVQHDCIRHDDYRSLDFFGPMVTA